MPIFLFKVLFMENLTNIHFTRYDLTKTTIIVVKISIFSNFFDRNCINFQNFITFAKT